MGEMVHQKQYGYRNDLDVAKAGMFGFVTGGIFGGVGRHIGKGKPNVTVGQITRKEIADEAAKGAGKLSIRTDIVLSGGRSGQLVKNLTGPANSVVKGSKGRIFITDDAGRVVWDITKDRAKSVIPGKGFGPKVAPTQEQLNLLKQVWGN